MRHFEIWFPKKRTITFFWSKLSKLHKKDPILHVATTFSLKQGETRTSHVHIPHHLTLCIVYVLQGKIMITRSPLENKFIRRILQRNQLSFLMIILKSKGGTSLQTIWNYQHLFEKQIVWETQKWNKNFGRPSGSWFICQNVNNFGLSWCSLL